MKRVILGIIAVSFCYAFCSLNAAAARDPFAKIRAAVSEVEQADKAATAAVDTFQKTRDPLLIGLHPYDAPEVRTALERADKARRNLSKVASKMRPKRLAEWQAYCQECHEKQAEKEEKRKNRIKTYFINNT